MRMSVLIILLCIQMCLTIQSVRDNARTEKEYRTKLEEPEDKTFSKNQSLAQYDVPEIEYVNEELGDSLDTDMNEPSTEGTKGKQSDFERQKRSNQSLPGLPKLRKMIRLVRAVLPSQNSSKTDDIESDVEEEEEFEDLDKNGSTEEEDETEVYDSIRSTTRQKDIIVNDKAKRWKVYPKKGTVSSSPDVIDNGEDESLNENGGGDYGEMGLLPTRKEIVTVKQRKTEMTPKSYNIPTVSTKYSNRQSIKDNRIQVTNKGVVHENKGKLLRNREPKSISRSGPRRDFEDLKKAYKALVCSVEDFMRIANKTVRNLENADCASSESCVTVSICTTPSICKTPATEGSFDFGLERRSTTLVEGECTTVVEDSDSDPSEVIGVKLEEEEDINATMKKKHKKKDELLKSDDTIEKSGGYVYSDYDSVDPNEDDTDVIPVKSSSFPTLRVNRRKHFYTTQVIESGMTERFIEPSTKTVSSVITGHTKLKVPPPPAEPQPKWTTVHYETKIKLRHSKKQARRVTTELQKLISRRRHFSAPRTVKIDTSNEPSYDATNYPMLRNIPPSQEGDTQIIEVEYV